MWVIDLQICLHFGLFLQLLRMRHCFVLLVPNDAPNNGHIPTPMEVDDDDDHDHDDDDDDDEDDE